DVSSVLRWLLWHLSELQFSVAVVPLFALILLCVRGRSLQAADRAVVAATVSLVAWFCVEVAAFASQPSVQRIEERNLFYVAPLLDRAPRPRARTRPRLDPADRQQDRARVDRSRLPGHHAVRSRLDRRGGRLR